jgi:hypothetical protein
MNDGLFDTSVLALPPPLKLNPIGAGEVAAGVETIVDCPKENIDFDSAAGTGGVLGAAPKENGDAGLASLSLSEG